MALALGILNRHGMQTEPLDKHSLFLFRILMGKICPQHRILPIQPLIQQTRIATLKFLRRGVIQ